MLYNYIFVYESISFKNGKIVSPATFVNKLDKQGSTQGCRNGTENFFGLKGRPSVVRDVKIHNQPVLWMRRK
jgi:hypothetical protein